MTPRPDAQNKNRFLKFIRILITKCKILCQQYWRALRHKLQAMDDKAKKALKFKIWIIGGGAVLLFWLLLILQLTHHKQAEKVSVKQQASQMQLHSQTVVEKTNNVIPLERIQNELTQLLQKPSSSPIEKADHEQLEQLSSRLSSMIQGQKIKEAESEQQIASVIQSQKALVDSNNAVKVQLTQIHKAVMPVHYLPVSTLPFQVEGLSFWNGAPMVTIAMTGLDGQHFYKLIGVGGEYGCSYLNSAGNGCTSWIVKHIDVNSGEVVFANHHGQFVKVTL